MEMIFVLPFWVVASIAIGVAAKARGRDALGWFFLALLISPLLAPLILAAYPLRFEAEGLYKGTPYRSARNDIEAMLPGGKVTFRNMDEFTSAIDGRTIALRRDDPPRDSLIETIVRDDRW